MLASLFTLGCIQGWPNAVPETLPAPGLPASRQNPGFELRGDFKIKWNRTD